MYSEPKYRSVLRSTGSVRGPIMHGQKIQKPLAGRGCGTVCVCWRREQSALGALVGRHHRRPTEPDVVLQRRGDVVDLPLVGGAAQLPGELGALCQAGRAQWMALGDQPA